MLLAVDVQYGEEDATVAGVTFAQWQTQAPDRELTLKVPSPAQYEPGEFYKRELPCILALLEAYDLKPELILVDGFVFLDGESRPGLGKRLYDALNGEIPVIGVAKSPFAGIPPHFGLCRGESSKPLFVTAVGIDTVRARQAVADMHGQYRLPTLLRRVDQLSKGSPPATHAQRAVSPRR